MLMDLVSMSGTIAAGIYLFTTDSPFNQIQFTSYVIDGLPIIPFLGSTGSYSSAGDLTNGSEWMAQQTTGVSSPLIRSPLPSSSGIPGQDSTSLVSANSQNVTLNSCDGEESLSGGCGPVEYGQS